MNRRNLLRFVADGATLAAWWQSGWAAPHRRQDSMVQHSEFWDFDPALHGFGFPNWEGSTGTGATGVQFTLELGTQTKDDVWEAIDDSWTTSLTTAQQMLMTRIVYSWIGGNAATNGHCFGMTFAAEAYFRDPSKLPAGVKAASEVPHPTGRYADVGDRIRRLQTAQLLRAEPYWFVLLGLRWGLADHAESLERLTAAIESTGTAGIALDGESNAHQVLAYGYEQTTDATTVFVYDPTLEAAAYDDPEDVWALSVDRESGEILEIRDGYEEFLYYHPDLDLSVTDRLIDGRDRVLELLSNAIFLGLETSGKLEIAVPESVLIDRPGAEYADVESAHYGDVALILDPPDEFSVTLNGKIGDEYVIEVLGLRENELVVDNIVSGTIEEELLELVFSIDDTGAIIMDVIGSEDQHPGMDTSWIMNNWWLPAGVAVLSLAALYLYFSRVTE